MVFKKFKMSELWALSLYHERAIGDPQRKCTSIKEQLKSVI
jgi:hypothetical protein